MVLKGHDYHCYSAIVRERERKIRERNRQTEHHEEFYRFIGENV